MPQTPDSSLFMREALAEAGKGLGLTAPNPAVGAVVVKDGEIVGRGYHHQAGKPHAEPLALRDAGDRARGADLYVTLEPCSTQGRTPPCTRAVIEAGIRRVFVGCIDPNPLHAGAGIDLLRQAGLEVVSGLLESECRHLIRAFARVQETGLPWLTLKLAVSLDGRIADHKGQSKWITGPASRSKVQDLRREADAVLVGTETILQDDPSLLPRPRKGHAPWRIVPDRTGRLPLQRQVFQDAHRTRTLCLVGPSVTGARIQRLDNLGVSVLRIPERISWSSILRQLARRGLHHILCEGGGQLAAPLLRKGLVQDLHLVQAPILLGQKGRPMVADAWTIDKCPRLWPVSRELVGEDLWQHFQPIT